MQHDYAIVLTPREFQKWLRSTKKGERCIYFKGDALPENNKSAQIAREALELTWITLHVRRAPDSGFHYIAVRK